MDGLEIRQEGNTVHGGDVIGQQIINNHYPKATRLASLFEKLKSKIETNTTVEHISDNLKRLSEDRDVVGLEQKLIDGQREYLLSDAMWLKQEYAKKLTKYTFFEPAQEIHAYLLSAVLEKFRNIIYPMIINNRTHEEISQVISNHIINPIITIIQEEGCEDVMGLCAIDIEGMIYYLTGKCHIKWKL